MLHRSQNKATRLSSLLGNNKSSKPNGFSDTSYRSTVNLYELAPDAFLKLETPVKRKGKKISLAPSPFK